MWTEGTCSRPHPNAPGSSPHCPLVAPPGGATLAQGQPRERQDSSRGAAAAAAAAAAKSLQSCPTLCDPIDGSPPGSLVPGILQARTLEWDAISFSNA